MAYLEWLEQSLQDAAARDAIGEPVAVRAYLALGEDHGELARTTGAAVAMAGRLLGQPLEALHAQGSPERGEISVHAAFDGRIAMLSAELVRAGKPRDVKVVLLGEKGTVSHEDEPGADGLPVDLRPPDAARETALVERSLRTEGPVEP